MALLVFTLLGCGPTLEDPAACEGVSCTAGTCVVEGGQPRCVCSAFEEAAGVVCELRDPASPGGGSIADAVPLEPSAELQQGALLFPNQQTYADQNVYVFSATAGEVYRFTVTFDVENRYTVKVMDASGAILAQESCGSASGQAYHVGLVAPSSGPLYLGVGHGSGCGHARRESGYSLLFEALGPDDHADAPDAATLQVPGPAQPGRLELDGDVDWFTFDAEAGHIYRFRCDPDAQWHCQLALHDAQGQRLERYERASTAATVSVEATQATRYLVSLTRPAWPYELGWATYSYRLEDLGLDDHGDTLPEATPLVGLAQWVTAHLETEQDLDVFYFETVAGHIYHVVPEDPLASTRLELHGAAGGSLLVSSGGLGFEGGDLRFLRVGGGAYPEVGSFRFQLVDLGPDDHGDTEDTASPLGVGETQGQHELGTDVDVFAFPAEDGHVYELRCSNCSTELRAATGTLRTLRYGDFTLVEASAADTVFVKVKPSWVSNGRTYTVGIVDRGRDDYGDSAATAHAIAAGEEVSGSLEVYYDRDVFSVPLVAGQVYSFASGSYAPFAELRSPDGGPVESQWSELGVRYLPAQSGVHTLTVSCGPSPSIQCGGPYRFTLQ